VVIEIVNQELLSGRVAIITGGARGLGRAMAHALAAAGASVLIVARSADQVAATVSETEKLSYSGKIEGLVADVSSEIDCYRIVETAEERLGDVSVLVNNAAIGPYAAKEVVSIHTPFPFWTIDGETIANMVKINLLGPFHMFRAVAPRMVQRAFGKIVNISTSRTTMRRTNSGPYGPLKAGLEAATSIWAEELEGSGVTANVLLPGGLSDTSFVPGGVVGQRAKPFRAGKAPIGDEGSKEFLPPDIMGPPIVWLASDQSNGISGRRFVARDWDPDLPAMEAAQRAMQQPSATPVIM
jgi:NAD(P)-dependent dehydrogenase (short-subunit alcohol dehydrogenase family)